MSLKLHIHKTESIGYHLSIVLYLPLLRDNVMTVLDAVVEFMETERKS